MHCLWLLLAPSGGASDCLESAALLLFAAQPPPSSAEVIFPGETGVMRIQAVRFNRRPDRVTAIAVHQGAGPGITLRTRPPVHEKLAPRPASYWAWSGRNPPPPTGPSRGVRGPMANHQPQNLAGY